MELKWLEDFVTVAEKGHFARAASDRLITQSALSRRIQSLENWVGAELLDRSEHPIQLTPAGREFIRFATDIITQAHEGRALTSRYARINASSVTISSLHTLTLSYIPSLITWLQDQIGFFSSSVVAETRTVEEYLISLSNGSSDFFVCYDHPSLTFGMDADEFPKLELSQHNIYPYQSVGLPMVDLNQPKGESIDYLAYTPTTYMSRVVERCLSRTPARNRLRTVYRASLAESIFTATQKGLGLSWLPETVAPGTAKENGVVRVSDVFSTQLKICIYRSARNPDPLVQEIWDSLEGRLGQLGFDDILAE